VRRVESVEGELTSSPSTAPPSSGPPPNRGILGYTTSSCALTGSLTFPVCVREQPLAPRGVLAKAEQVLDFHWCAVPSSPALETVGGESGSSDLKERRCSDFDAARCLPDSSLSPGTVASAARATTARSSHYFRSTLHSRSVKMRP
jgi:hypothetical protein